jgi:hypothetical protein
MSIVQGSIGPIKAEEIRLDKLVIPVPVPDNVHIPQLISNEPVVIAPITLAHARACAERVMAMAGSLPHTEQAGDLLAMALTILHYTAKEDDHE